MDSKAKIEELRTKIEYHSNRYYNEDNPEISDYEYDMLMQKAAKGPPGIYRFEFSNTESRRNGKAAGRRFSSS